MKKGRKCVDRPPTEDKGLFSLGARPENLDYENYKELRKMQNKLLKMYLKNPSLFKAVPKFEPNSPKTE
jgi:hypothetical protein